MNSSEVVLAELLFAVIKQDIARRVLDEEIFYCGVGMCTRRRPRGNFNVCFGASV